jgi:RIO-like serine/threonine protein kinase
MCIVTDGSEKPIPQGAEKLTDNHISIVWRGNDGFIYKRSIPYLINNEYHFLKAMANTGFVPKVERYDKYTLKIEDLGKSEPITNVPLFYFRMGQLLGVLHKKGIRHGDLTEKAFIIKDNWPMVIDWAESRWASDPAVDKRPAGDNWWIRQTMDKLTNE